MEDCDTSTIRYNIRSRNTVSSDLFRMTENYSCSFQGELESITGQYVRAVATIGNSRTFAAMFYIMEQNNIPTDWII